MVRSQRRSGGYVALNSCAMSWKAEAGRPGSIARIGDRFTRGEIWEAQCSQALLRLRAIIALDDHEIGLRLAKPQLARRVVFARTVACERAGKIGKLQHHETRPRLALDAFGLAAANQKPCAV